MSARLNPGDTFDLIVTCPDTQLVEYEVEMTAHGNGFATWDGPCGDEHTMSTDEITLCDDDTYEGRTRGDT